MHRMLPFAAALLLPAGPADAQAQAEAPVVAEARAFMAAYADELRRGDRPAIAARYDRRGAHLLGRGGKETLTHAQLAAVYAGPDWRPPAAFAWRNLDYDPLGPDAVAITGLFDWTLVTGQAPMTFSYTSVLVRQDGALRIRIEDEDPAPPPRPAAR